MPDKLDDVLNFIAHYSSQYYDPQKAHEYYLKNRELKGRSTSGMTDAQKEAWTYAKDKITTERKDVITETGNELKADIENLRNDATKRREALSKKLTDLLAKATALRQHDAGVISQRSQAAREKIAAKLKDDLEKVSERARKDTEKLSEFQRDQAKKISEEASRKIDALPPIPKGISAERRAELTAKRSEEIAKIRGTATKDHDALSKSVKEKKGAIAAKAKVEKDGLTKQADSDREGVSKKTSSQRENLSKWSSADKDKNRQRVGAERQAVATELKGAIDKGRAYYQDAKEKIKAQYEDKLNTEFEAIKRNV